MLTTNNGYCSSSSSVPLRSTWARAVLNKIENDRCLQTLDRKQWYRLSHPDLLAERYRERFLELHDDEETTTFLQRSTKKSDQIVLQIIHTLVTSFLTLFLTRTSANGLIGRGRMFVYSTTQFRTLLNLQSSLPTLLDIGAGDGSVTERMSHLFDKVYVTEFSSTMRWRLSTYGYTTLDTDHWTNLTFDVITCLNVLDRCEKPQTLLKQIREHLTPKTGRLVISLVLPYKPYFEYNDHHRPEQFLAIEGDQPEEQINHFLTHVIEPLGFRLAKLTRLPYLCEGDIHRSYYFLSAYIFVLEMS